MNKEKQRVKIAEACGWTFQWTDAGCHVGMPGNDNFWDALDGEPGDVGRMLSANEVPDYLNDLNAMHEAEKKVIGHSDYFEILAKVCGYKHYSGAERNEHLYCCIDATAAQRAEAFLRTLNLWEDGE